MFRCLLGPSGPSWCFDFRFLAVDAVALEDSSAAEADVPRPQAAAPGDALRVEDSQEGLTTCFQNEEAGVLLLWGKVLPWKLGLTESRLSPVFLSCFCVFCFLNETDCGARRPFLQPLKLG